MISRISREPLVYKTDYLNIISTGLGFCLLLAACSFGVKGVYFEEMRAEPVLSLNKQILTVKTSNSKTNSALLIYRVNILVDQNRKEICLSADLAVGKKFQDVFTIDLAAHQISEPGTFTFYWLDPDRKTTPIYFNKSTRK